MIILCYVRIIYEFYELVSLWFGCIMCLMIVSYVLGNFMWWELCFSWVWELGCDWGISLYIRKSLSVISFGFSFRWREREHRHLSSSCIISHAFCFQVRDLWHVLLISIKIISKTIMHSNFLSKDITYKHDLSKIYVRELFNLIYDNFSILMLVPISRT